MLNQNGFRKGSNSLLPHRSNTNSTNQVVDHQSRNTILIVTNNFKDTFNSTPYTLSQSTPRINATIGQGNCGFEQYSFSSQIKCFIY